MPAPLAGLLRQDLAVAQDGLKLLPPSKYSDYRCELLHPTCHCHQAEPKGLLVLGLPPTWACGSLMALLSYCRAGFQWHSRLLSSGSENSFQECRLVAELTWLGPDCSLLASRLCQSAELLFSAGHLVIYHRFNPTRNLVFTVPIA